MALSGLPASSAPLPWQGESWSRLAGQQRSDKLPHALLLVGPQHTGKALLALALARLLLCAQPSNGRNCGQCHACALSASGSHGDWRWLQPETDSRIIKVEQVRELVEFTNRTASFGRCKVAVLAPAECMNASAANALLKSLEEPAADTYLILISHRPHGVPATLRSRCQILRPEVPTAEQSLVWLDRLTAERAQSETLLEVARGKPLLAQQLFREGSAQALAATQGALCGFMRGRVPLAEAAVALSELSVDAFLAQFAAQLRGLLRNCAGVDLSGYQGRALFVLLDDVMRLQRAVDAGSNPNRQLLLESVLGKYCRVLGAAGLGDTIPAPSGRHFV